MQRKHIRVILDAAGQPQLVTKGSSGREVTGVSLHRPSQRLYRIEGGTRVYFQGLRDALKWADGPTYLAPLNTAWIEEQLTEHLKKRARSKLRLSDCLAFWVQQKTDRDLTPSYTKFRTTLFGSLVSAIGDKSVDQLTKQDFVQFE